MISSLFDRPRPDLLVMGSPVAIVAVVTITTSLVSRAIFQGASQNTSSRNLFKYKKVDYIRMAASFIVGVLAGEGLKMAQRALVGPQHKMISAAVTLCSIAGATLGTLFVLGLDGLARAEG